jgi:hypothetical protein
VFATNPFAFAANTLVLGTITIVLVANQFVFVTNTNVSVTNTVVFALNTIGWVAISNVSVAWRGFPVLVAVAVLYDGDRISSAPAVSRMVWAGDADSLTCSISAIAREIPS